MKRTRSIHGVWKDIGHSLHRRFSTSGLKKMCLCAADAQDFQIISTLRYDPGLPAAATAAADKDPEAYPVPRDTPYYLLSYHYDRLLSAAKHFEWGRAIETLENLSSDNLESFAHTLDRFIPDNTKTWRLRIILSIDGTIEVGASPTPPFSSHRLLFPPLPRPYPIPFMLTSMPSGDGDPWRLFLDSQPITPSGFTTHKTTARKAYTDARVRVGIHTPQALAEVLVYNPDGEVMEGSITTPYFGRRSRHAVSEDDGPGMYAHWVTPPLSSGGNAGTTRRYALSRGFCIERIIKTTDLMDGDICWLSNGVRGFFQAVVHLNRESPTSMDHLL